MTIATPDAKPYPEPGQMWEDLDDRAVNQEFTIVAVVDAQGTRTINDPTPSVRRLLAKHGPVPADSTDPMAAYVIARRARRHVRIAVARLLANMGTESGYRYMGRSR